MTAVIAAVFLLVLDGRAFNANTRRPQYQEVDGSVSRSESYSPLQSDITTAASLAAAVTRVAATAWAAGYIWRCIFVSLEQGGISLQGISQLISGIWPAPAPHHFSRTSNMVIIYITLLATFALDYFSAALTGSLVWEASDRLISGSVRLPGIGRGVSGADITGYLTYPASQHPWIVAGGCASANLAWAAPQLNSILNITEFPATRTSRRVIGRAQYLLTNSTLANVTVPYFTVDAFEWITQPDSILTDNQTALFHQYGEFSPFFSLSGIGGLLPDSKWGPPDAQLGEPHVVSETRFFIYRTERRDWAKGPCPQNYTIDPGSQINLHAYQYTDVWYDCFAVANVTYRAGAAICQNCKLVSPMVVEAQGPLSLIPDSFSSMALGLAPSLGTNLLFTNYSVPQNYGTIRDFAIELTSRSYQAAWATFSDGYGNQVDSTEVEIALPTLRAKVIAWRVYLWMALHLAVWVLGLLFIYFQSYCDHPWVEGPAMAVFWLDTSAVPAGADVDPWQPGMEIPNDGMLILVNAGQRSRSVKIK